MVKISKKILLAFCLVFLLFTSVLLSSCNEVKTINVIFDFSENVSPFINGVYENGVDEYYSDWQTYFPDDNDYVQPVLKMKAGINADISPLMFVKEGYKIDKVYYLDNKSQEVILYAYVEGDFLETGENINGYKIFHGWNHTEQYFTLPDYDITIHILSSAL